MDQDLLTADILSFGDGQLKYSISLWLDHSADASLLTFSLPSILVWLGIQTSVVRVSLNLSSRVLTTVSLCDWVDAVIVLIAELESQNTIISGYF